MLRSPNPTPETEPFWEGTAAGELRLQRCSPCDRHYFVPRPFCPRCGSQSVRWEKVSGRGTITSYTISQRAMPGGRDDVPFILALVTLQEGPRLLAELVGFPTEHIELDTPVAVDFVSRGGMHVPVFREEDGR
jgi:hypothetical protein